MTIETKRKVKSIRTVDNNVIYAIVEDDNTDYVDLLVYDCNSEEWQFEISVKPAEINQLDDLDDISREELENKLNFDFIIKGDLDWLIESSNDYLDELGWMLDVLSRSNFDDAANDENDATKYFIPPLEAYILVNAAIRDEVFDDFEYVKVFINGEMSEVKKIAKTEYEIRNDVMPSTIVEADDMFDAIKSLPYVLGQSFPYRMSDVRYKF